MAQETTIKAPDLNVILKPFENKWVALSPDETQVVSSGDTLFEAESKLNEKERHEAVFFKVIPFNVGIAPAAS